MDYKKFINEIIIPILKNDLDEGAINISHVFYVINEKNNLNENNNTYKNFFIDNNNDDNDLDFDDYEENDTEIFKFLDNKIIAPYNIETHRSIITDLARLLKIDLIITTTYEVGNLEDEINIAYNEYINSENLNEIILNNNTLNSIKIIISVESYESNDKFLYEYKDGNINFIKELIPDKRLYLPYLN